MSNDSNDASGLTPEQWRKRLEEALLDPGTLARELVDLEKEMKGERSFLHCTPSPDSLLKSVMGFLMDKKDDDYERLGKKVKAELAREQKLLKRYRTWKDGEDFNDRLFMYLKDFAAKVKADMAGIQFPGFLKYQGIYNGPEYSESYIFYINERFPGRDPANFHVVFYPKTGKVIIKRVYKMELPRYEGKCSAARSILKEMINEIVPDHLMITEIEVDNAANIETRKLLLGKKNRCQDEDLEKTPLGYLMKKLLLELGLLPGSFNYQISPFDIIKIELFTIK